MGFNKCNSPFHHDNISYRITSLPWKSVFPLFIPVSSPHTPGNHCLYCFAFPEYHINGIVQYTAFSNQHLHLTYPFVVWQLIFFYSWILILLYGFIIVYSSIESYFASFQFLTIMNRAVKYIIKCEGIDILILESFNQWT